MGCKALTSTSLGIGSQNFKTSKVLKVVKIVDICVLTCNHMRVDAYPWNLSKLLLVVSGFLQLCMYIDINYKKKKVKQ